MLMAVCRCSKCPAPHMNTHFCMQQGFIATAADGTQCLCVPVLAVVIADLQEMASLLNVRSYPAAFPDANYIVHRDELNSVEDKFPPRTMAFHEKARSLLRHMHAFPRLPAATSTWRLMLIDCFPGAQFRVAALKLRSEGASQSTVDEKLQEGGLRNTFKVPAPPLWDFCFVCCVPD